MGCRTSTRKGWGLLGMMAMLGSAQGQAQPPALSGGACGEPGGAPGARTVRHGETFGILHEPDNGWHRTNCHWELECPDDATTVTFTRLETEQGWDYVNVFSAGNEDAASSLAGSHGSTGDLAHHSGVLAEVPDVEGATLVQYITDGSVLTSPSGFLATLTCVLAADLQAGPGARWCSDWRTEECDVQALTQALGSMMAAEVLDPSTTATFSVVDSTDSAEEDVSSAVTTVGSPAHSLTLGRDGDDEKLVGIVFPNVRIPRSSAIISARVILKQADESSASAQCTIFGVLGPAERPSAEAGDLSNRTITTAAVLWDTASSSTGADGPNQREELHTPDISEVVREIVNDPSWESAAAMGLLFANAGSAGSTQVEVEHRNLETALLTPTIEITFVSPDDMGKLVQWEVRGEATQPMLIDRLPQEIYCPCHALARKMQASSRLSAAPSMPSVATQCRHADCRGTWTCDASCGRVWVEEQPQSGNGLACPPMPDGCQPGEGDCPRDCAGYFEPCTAACESNRTWVETAAQSGAGADCPSGLPCVAGEDDCMYGVDSDCIGTWLPCTDLCESSHERVWVEAVPHSGAGQPCPPATNCRPAEGRCAPNVDCAGSFSPCTTACEVSEDRTWIQTSPGTGSGAACPAPYRSPLAYVRGLEITLAGDASASESWGGGMQEDAIGWTPNFAFDGDELTGWDACCTAASEAMWIAFTFQEFVTAGRYLIKTMGSECPSHWTLYGGTTDVVGDARTVLDVQAGQSCSDHFFVPYDITSPGSYRTYKLLIDGLTDGSHARIRDIKFEHFGHDGTEGAGTTRLQTASCATIASHHYRVYLNTAATGFAVASPCYSTIGLPNRWVDEGESLHYTDLTECIDVCDADEGCVGFVDSPMTDTSPAHCSFKTSSDPLDGYGLPTSLHENNGTNYHHKIVELIAPAEGDSVPADYDYTRSVTSSRACQCVPQFDVSICPLGHEPITTAEQCVVAAAYLGIGFDGTQSSSTTPGGCSVDVASNAASWNPSTGSAPADPNSKQLICLTTDFGYELSGWRAYDLVGRGIRDNSDNAAVSHYVDTSQYGCGSARDDISCTLEAQSQICFAICDSKPDCGGVVVQPGTKVCIWYDSSSTVGTANNSPGDPPAQSNGACGPQGFDGAQAGPPGARTVRHGETFGILHEPDNGWHRTNCHWELECPDDATTVTFTRLETEQGWDYVNVFSAGNEDAASSLTGSHGSTGDLAHHSGVLAEVPDVEGATLVQYITDGSVLTSPSGFLATLTCGPGSGTTSSPSSRARGATGANPRSSLRRWYYRRLEEVEGRSCDSGQDECPADVDCVGSFSSCTAACESASERVWNQTAAPVRNGVACPAPADCFPGEGDCYDPLDRGRQQCDLYDDRDGCVMAGAECWHDATGTGNETGCSDNAITFEWLEYTSQYLAGCTSDGCVNHGSREAAEIACIAAETSCGGILFTADGTWQTRAGDTPIGSPNGESSWVKSIRESPCDYCGGAGWICCSSDELFQGNAYFSGHPCTGASYFTTAPGHRCVESTENARTSWSQDRFGDTAAGGGRLVFPAIQFRAEDITRDETTGAMSAWPSAIPGDSFLKFTTAQPVEPEVNYGAAAQPPTFVDSSSGSSPFAGAHFSPSATNEAMYSDKTVAVGGANTFFALVTPEDPVLPFGSIVGFRPQDALGVFSWVIGTHGCPTGPCLFTDDWAPSGYRGEAVQTGVTQLVIFRSELQLQGSGLYRPVVDMAIVDVLGADAASLELTWHSDIYGSGHEEYGDEHTEVFDLDLRNAHLDLTGVGDGPHAFAAGYMILGNWQLRHDMQFRGLIHQIELYDFTLTDLEVAVTSATILEEVAASAAAPGGTPATVPGAEEWPKPIVAVDIDADSGQIQITGSAVNTRMASCAEYDALMSAASGPHNLRTGLTSLRSPDGTSFETHCMLAEDLGSSGLPFTRFWHYDPAVANAAAGWSFPDDVLKDPYGSCTSPDECYGRLPEWLSEDGTEMVVTDGVTTIAFTFDSSHDVAHAAWEAFHDHIEGVIRDGHTWVPTVLQGSLGTIGDTDSFAYTDSWGVKSVLLDDDLCYCASALELGKILCHPENTWEQAAQGGSLPAGVDFVAPSEGCSYASPDKGPLSLYFREAQSAVPAVGAPAPVPPGWVISVSGLDIAWNEPATMAEGLEINPGDSEYTFVNVPDYMVGLSYWGSRAFPSASGGDWIIQFTPPLILYIWVHSSQYNAGVDAQLGGDGWTLMQADNFQRSDGNSLSVWGKSFDPAAPALATETYTITTTGLMVGGVVWEPIYGAQPWYPTVVTWFNEPQPNWQAARDFCTAEGMTLATAEQICPEHPGGLPDETLSGDHWVAFAGDPDGIDNAWLQVGDGRPTLTCYSHHSGQDGHHGPPAWGEDSSIHGWMGWVVCSAILDTQGNTTVFPTACGADSDCSMFGEGHAAVICSDGVCHCDGSLCMFDSSGPHLVSGIGHDIDHHRVVAKVHGEPSIVEGPFGELDAMSFGYGDWLQLGDTGVAFLPDDPWTIDCWIKMTAESYLPALRPQVLAGGFGRDLRVAVWREHTELGAVGYLPADIFSSASASGECVTIPPNFWTVTAPAELVLTPEPGFIQFLSNCSAGSSTGTIAGELSTIAGESYYLRVEASVHSSRSSSVPSSTLEVTIGEQEPQSLGPASDALVDNNRSTFEWLSSNMFTATGAATTVVLEEDDGECFDVRNVELCEMPQDFLSSGYQLRSLSEGWHRLTARTICTYRQAQSGSAGDSEPVGGPDNSELACSAGAQDVIYYFDGVAVGRTHTVSAPSQIFSIGNTANGANPWDYHVYNLRVYSDGYHPSQLPGPVLGTGALPDAVRLPRNYRLWGAQTWRLMYRQQLSTARLETHALNYNEGLYSGDFSELGHLEQCRQSDGKFQFKMLWPDLRWPRIATVQQDHYCSESDPDSRPDAPDATNLNACLSMCDAIPSCTAVSWYGPDATSSGFLNPVEWANKCFLSTGGACTPTSSSVGGTIYSLSALSPSPSAPLSSVVTWFNEPQPNWQAARDFCTAEGMTLATAEQICPEHPGGLPDETLSGDHWVAFAGDPDGIDNAWLQVGDGRPTLTCYSHHSGQDGHHGPPAWGEDSSIHGWMGWVVCATNGAPASNEQSLRTFCETRDVNVVGAESVCSYDNGAVYAANSMEWKQSSNPADESTADLDRHVEGYEALLNGDGLGGGFGGLEYNRRSESLLSGSPSCSGYDVYSSAQSSPVGSDCVAVGCVYTANWAERVDWMYHPGMYLADCTSDGCVDHGSLEWAQAACLSLGSECSGITHDGTWQTRAAGASESPSGEDSWQKVGGAFSGHSDAAASMFIESVATTTECMRLCDAHPGCNSVVMEPLDELFNCHLKVTAQSAGSPLQPQSDPWRSFYKLPTCTANQWGTLSGRYLDEGESLIPEPGVASTPAECMGLCDATIGCNSAIWERDSHVDGPHSCDLKSVYQSSQSPTITDGTDWYRWTSLYKNPHMDYAIGLTGQHGFSPFEYSSSYSNRHEGGAPTARTFAFAGGDVEDSELDFSGSFVYAVDIAGPGRITIGDATFTPDAPGAVDGLSVTASYVRTDWHADGPITYGDSERDDALELLTQTIRWSRGDGVTVTMAVTPGVVYRLQLLFHEQTSMRGFDILIDGETLVDEYSPQIDQGGISGSGRPGAAVSVDLVAGDSGTLNVTLDGSSASFDNTNPFLNALTLEVMPDLYAPGPTAITKPHSLPGGGAPDSTGVVTSPSVSTTVLLYAKCDVVAAECPNPTSPTTEAECQHAAEAAGLALGGGGHAFAGAYAFSGCYTYEGNAFWSTTIGGAAVVLPRARVYLCDAFSGGASPDAGPATPCSRSDCCGLEVLSNDHDSGVVGTYFNFMMNPSCVAPGVDFEVAQYRGGLPIWTGLVTSFGSVNGGSSGDDHGRRQGGQGPGQFEAGDFLCVLECAGGTGR